MQTHSATNPGNPGRESEDWHYADHHTAIIIDGATVRTDTGCVHGVPWYVEHLGGALVDKLSEHPRTPAAALRHAIKYVRTLHPQCDLDHPGTPSAAVGIATDTGGSLVWLVLGDVTIAVNRGREITATVDDRVSQTAHQERLDADQYAIDSPEKIRALQTMKKQELAARNTPGGYWIAAADPTAVDHALLGAADRWEQLALLTDGAARAHIFGTMSWQEIFDMLASDTGTDRLIQVVRQAENSDPSGVRWPRNKKSDDATVIYARPDTPANLRVGDRVTSQWDTNLTGHVIEVFGDQEHLRVKWDTSPTPVQMPASQLYKTSTPPVSHAGDRD